MNLSTHLYALAVTGGDMPSFALVTKELFEGFGITCLLFVLTLIFSLPLGLLVCMGTMSKIKPIKAVMKTIVWIVRGIPLMLQLFIVAFGPGLIGITIPDVYIPFFGNEIEVSSRFIAALIAFAVNYACYFSEIYRGGIESISKGQSEAGQVLGMTKSQIFFKVVLLQVIKRITPPMSNEIITLVKDTALARTIAVVEIMDKAYEFAQSSIIWPIFYTGIFYLLFVGVLTIVFNKLEKKLDYFKA